MNTRSALVDTSVEGDTGHATRVTDLGSGNIKKVTVSDPQRHGSGVNSYVVSPARIREASSMRPFTASNVV